MKQLFLFSLVFCGWLLAQSAVYVNQCGYQPELKKIAYTNQAADSFYIKTVTSDATVFKGTWQLRKTDDPGTGLDLWQAEFSALKVPGSYILESGSGERSPAFSVSDTAFSAVTVKSFKGFYFQRCGMALDSAYAGPYAHASGHSTDGLFHTSCDTSGFMNVKGGWHDAGDYGKYMVPAADAVGTLLMLAEWFPDYLSSDNLNIPESGNGTPDLLDEIRYELEWMMRMQDPGDGGSFFKVTTKSFVGWVMPQNSHEARYIYGKSTTASAGFAAVSARAARVFQPFDAGFAQSCREAAERVWDYLQTHTSIVPEGGFTNPSDTETGEYGDADDRDERLWVAAELFATTGSDKYNQYFQEHYQETPLFDEQMSWANEKPLALLTYLKTTTAGVNPMVQETIRSALYDYCDEKLNIIQNDGFRVALKDWEYYWGSNSVALNNAILLIMAYDQSLNTDYRDGALHQLDYILGTNGHNMTFVTNVGTRYPHNIHHAPSATDGVEKPVPGLLAGGPNKYLNDPELQAAFNASTPPAICYLDVLGSYASNEIAIYWNAPLVFVAAYFNAGNNGTSILDEMKTVPNSFNLKQNYPNPFNPETTINYRLPVVSRARLTVYNLLGQKIKKLVDIKQQPGTYQVIFNAGSLSSGIYFYRLEIDNALSQTKKMVILR